MTQTSLEELKKFLGKCDFGSWRGKMRIADYGGTEKVGSSLVKEILLSHGINNYNPLDIDNGIDLRKPIKGEKFHLGICMDLMEHVSNPFIVAKNIIDSLIPGALLFVTTPFVWHVHGKGYSDYWRFTPEGLAELFKDMEMGELYSVRDTFMPPSLPLEVMQPEPPFIRIIGIFRKKDEKS